MVDGWWVGGWMSWWMPQFLGVRGGVKTKRLTSKFLHFFLSLHDLQYRVHL